MKRCVLAPKFAQAMVDIYKSLKVYRQKSNVFSSDGVVTVRDLIKWGKRVDIVTIEDLAYEGYFLLAERLRERISSTINFN